MFLALALKRPCCSRARPGRQDRGRQVISRWTGGELIRLQCYRASTPRRRCTTGTTHASSDLRAAEASGEARGLGTGVLEEQLYNERFLLKRALLQAIDHRNSIPPVLLIDEIDRADDEFEAYLLEMLSDYQITIPELGSSRRPARPSWC